jgi:diguanylate cyclase (GGDEF)-like protein/PAS domain S-box-containing protein
MEYEEKAKEQLLNELKELRHRIAELELSNSAFKGVKKALGDSEKNFFPSFRFSSDFIVISSLADGRFIEVNDCFLQAAGYRREELIGHTVFELNMWADPQERDAFSQVLREQGSLHNVEVAFRKKSGEVCKVLMFAELIEIAAEQCILTVSKDITERKRTEEEGAKYQEQLEELVAERTAELKAINEQLQQEITERKRAEKALRSFQSDLQAKNKSLEILNTIADKIYGSLDVQTVAEQAVAAMMNYSQAPCVGIFVLNAASQCLESRYVIGFSEEVRRGITKVPLKGSLSGVAVARKGLITSDNIMNDDRVEPEVKKALLKQGLQGIISVPLLFQDQALGVINLFFKGDIPSLTDFERETLMHIGKTIGLAMANANYIAQIETEIKERTRVEELLQRERETFYSTIQEAPNGVALIDKNGRYLFTNAEFTNITGYTLDDIATGNDWFNRAYPNPNYREEAIEIWKKDLGHKAFARVFSVVCKGGAVKEIEFKGTVLEDGKIIITLSDITERKQTEEVLRESETRLRKLFEAMPEAVMVHDDEGNILLINDVGAKRLEWTVEDLVGRNLREIVKSESVAFIPDHARIAHTDGSCSFETTYISRNGRLIVAEVNERPIILEGRSVILSVARDITERKRAEQQLAYMATHDALTGLPNRMLFNDRLTLALAQAHRHQQRLAVMLLDLDRFKDINDTLGHSVGDQLLHVVSKRLKNLLRKSDTLGRMGGDEFLFLVPDMTRLENATEVARKILESFQEPFLVENHELRTAASIGITIYPDDGADADTLLKNADIAMYSAKQKGRNNYQRYTSTMKSRSPE